MRESKNQLEKPICLRNAIAANEKLAVKEKSRFDSIPANYGDGISSGHVLMICTKVTASEFNFIDYITRSSKIWRKDAPKDFFDK